MEQRNLILAIVLSASILLGWMVFVDAPRMQKEQAAQDLLGDQVDAPITREAFLADVREAAALLAAVEAR